MVSGSVMNGAPSIELLLTPANKTGHIVPLERLHLHYYDKGALNQSIINQAAHKVPPSCTAETLQRPTTMEIMCVVSHSRR